MCVTKYKWRDGEKWQLVASEKFDVTDQIKALGLVEKDIFQQICLCATHLRNLIPPHSIEGDTKEKRELLFYFLDMLDAWNGGDAMQEMNDMRVDRLLKIVDSIPATGMEGYNLGIDNLKERLLKLKELVTI